MSGSDTNRHLSGGLFSKGGVCVPTAPRNVISNVNETSLVLEWSEPRDSGGRDDLLYNVICKKCSVERRLCMRCDDNVEFVPRQLGLTERRIYISNLMAHTQYTFEIQAVNGVSSKDPQNPHFASVNITTNQAAPSAVPSMHLHGSTGSSMTLSWEPPKQPNGIILDYEIKYFEKQGQIDGIANTVTSQKNLVRLEGLKPNAAYMVQVRARTVAGYGQYSHGMEFRTPVENGSSSKSFQELPLIVGSATACLVFLIAVVVIAIVCFRKQQNSADSEYTEKLQQYITPGMKVYIDPFTYEDPNEAVREFAKEIDISCVKIEEVIGAGKSRDFSPPRVHGLRLRNVVPMDTVVTINTFSGAHQVFLERGEFGEVCRGRLKLPGRREIFVAIKTLKVGYTDRQRRDFLSEASIMGQFDHPNIIHLEGVVTKSRPVMIVTEFMENCALDSFLRRRAVLPIIQLGGDARELLQRHEVPLGDELRAPGLAARNIAVNSNLVCVKVSDQGSGFLEGRIPRTPPTPAHFRVAQIDPV
uniref:Ephrin type-B receptor 3 n=1 Tax=Sphaerodactylus townsendi TaxID=933632 RepID=A0ACB8FBS0_9SAUR